MSPRPQKLKATISADLAGQRLDKALMTLLAAEAPGLSRVRLQALITGGHVTRDTKPTTDSSRKVKINEAFVVHVPPPEAAEPLAQKIKLTVVYEDKDLLVIDKPAGMVVHPAPGNRDKTLVNALLAHCGKSLSGIGGVARPGIVHRLDKETSGLMVVAKNDTAHQKLSQQFSDRSLSRTYLAVVWGVPAPRMGEIDASIGRHPRDRKKMAVTGKGKVAATKYRVLETFGIRDSGFGIQEKNWSKISSRIPNPKSQILSLLECKLATGRTHQIRVHLAHIKHPVVGDPVYGKQNPSSKADKIIRNFPRQALHAAELRFNHPRTGKSMRFKSKTPKDMARLLLRLRSII